ncbi:hypothetical protein ACH4OY_12310 [Micromonospora rubida]|uniref:Uncharacterized protein n=1 Tax=Micromonospora rubida TaxID=2697657 RepID=A0ABW7SID3_9ACTN
MTMIERACRGVLTVAVLTTAGLAVAAPARAATADITVTSASAVTVDQLQVNGTVTCTGSAGAAHISVSATQVMPFSFGMASMDVPCASGPVAWEIFIFSGFGWQSFHQVTVNAQMTDDVQGADSDSGNWWA